MRNFKVCVKINVDDVRRMSEISFECVMRFVCVMCVSCVCVCVHAFFAEIIGFGGAFTESSGYNFKKLSPELQEQFLELYWGEWYKLEF